MCSDWLRSLSSAYYWWRATASSRMHSLVTSLYFYWLFAILLWSDWLVINHNYYLSSALHNISCQVTKWTFFDSTCHSDIVEAKQKGRSKPNIKSQKIHKSQKNYRKNQKIPQQSNKS